MKNLNVLALLLVLALAAAACGSDTSTDAAVTTTEQQTYALTWSYDNGEEGVVILRANDPVGASEVLLDGEMIGQAFDDWVRDLPGAISFIDQVVREFEPEAKCIELGSAIADFESEAGSVGGAESTMYAAFAAYASDAATDAGCD